MSKHTIAITEENKLLIREYLSKYAGQMNIEFGINKIIAEWGLLKQVNQIKPVVCVRELRNEFTLGQQYISVTSIKNDGMKSGTGLLVVDNNGELRIICSSYFN